MTFDAAKLQFFFDINKKMVSFRHFRFSVYRRWTYKTTTFVRKQGRQVST